MDGSSAMTLRKCITGRVGDPTFQEVMSLLQWGPESATLRAHCGDCEVIVHFGREEVRYLRTPAGRPAGAPQGASPGALRALVLEIASWNGALFEYLEGTAFDGAPLEKDLAEIKEPASRLLEGLPDAAPPPQVRASIPGRDVDPQTAIDLLLRLLEKANSKSLLFRELAPLYLAASSSRRAGSCFRQLAAHLLRWGAPGNALRVLDAARKQCPADFHVVEDYVVLAQQLGESNAAEEAVRQILPTLESLGLEGPAMTLCSKLAESPADPRMKAYAGEALLRRGDTKGGVKEILAAASLLCARGKAPESTRLYARVLEAAPDNSEAGQRLARIKRRQRLNAWVRRWATLAGAIAIFGAWFSWDASSASAFESLESAGKSMEPHAAVSLVRQEAGKYPTTRFVKRLAGLESLLIEKCLDDDQRQIVAAYEALARGQLSRAEEILAPLVERSLFPLIRGRAQSARNEVAAQRDQVEKQLAQATQFLKSNSFDRAFEIHRKLLAAGLDQRFQASLLVPVRVETVPPGARVRAGGKDLGASPAWVLVPAERSAQLEVLLPEFSPHTVQGPAWVAVEKNNPLLRISLVPERILELPGAGGSLPRGAVLEGGVVPVLGADGVLRAVQGGKPRWRVPPDPSLGQVSELIVSGKSLALVTGQGKVLGYSLTRGVPQWEATLGKPAQGIRLGPVYAGSMILATSPDSSALIQAETGKIVRTLELPEKLRVRSQGISADTAVIISDAGDLLGIDLRSGKKLFEHPARFPGHDWVQLAGNQLVACANDGTVTVSSIDGQLERWKKPFSCRTTAEFSSSQKLIYVGTAAGDLVALKLLTGEEVWKTELGAQVTAITLPESADGRILLAHTARGKETVVMAIKLRDGKVLWEVPLGPREASWALLDRERAYLSSPGAGLLVIKIPG